MLRLSCRALFGFRATRLLFAAGIDLSAAKIDKKSIAELRDDLQELEGKKSKRDKVAQRRILELETQLCLRLSTTGREKDMAEVLQRGEAMWEHHLKPSIRKDLSVFTPGAMWSLRMTVCNIMSRTCIRMGNKPDSEMWKNRPNEKMELNNRSIVDQFFESESPEALEKRMKNFDKNMAGYSASGSAASAARASPSSSSAHAGDDDDEDDPLSMSDPGRRSKNKTHSSAEQEAMDDDEEDTPEEDVDDPETRKAKFAESLFQLQKGSPMDSYKYNYNKNHPYLERFFNGGKHPPGPRNT